MSDIQEVLPEQVAEPTPEAASRSEQIDAAWEKANAAEPEVTAEALDEKPATERKLAAPSIREFIRAQRPEPEPEVSGLEAEVRELRAALDSIAQRGRGEVPEPSKEELLLQKFEELQAQQEAELAAKREAEAAESFNREVEALRAAAIENINAVAETEYPGLAALEQQETVVNALFQRLEEGLDTSEDEVASEVESGLREVYAKLHAVYGNAAPVSKDPAPARATPQTLTTDLTGADVEPDLSKMTRREKIDYLWQKSKS